MASYLDQLRAHKRVAEVSVEDGGDTVAVVLARGWNAHGCCVDGTGHIFERIDDDDDRAGDRIKPIKDPAAAALSWVKNDVYPCGDAQCARCKS